MMMYRDPNGEVFAVLPGQEHIVKSSWVEMTPEEIDAHVNPPPPPPTAADIEAEASRRLRGAVEKYSPEERETWPEQVAEANAYLADSTAATPLLSAIATARGITVQAMAERVLLLRDQHKADVARILGAKSKLLAQSALPADFTSDSHWV